MNFGEDEVFAYIGRQAMMLHQLSARLTKQSSELDRLRAELAMLRAKEDDDADPQ